MPTCEHRDQHIRLLKLNRLESSNFRLEHEITDKVLRQGYWVYEVTVSYLGRTYKKGKKTRTIQDFYAIPALFQYCL